MCGPQRPFQRENVEVRFVIEQPAHRMRAIFSKTVRRVTLGNALLFALYLAREEHHDDGQAVWSLRNCIRGKRALGVELTGGVSESAHDSKGFEELSSNAESCPTQEMKMSRESR